MVLQGFIFPFEGSKEGPELFPWLAECFFGRRGMAGEDGLLPQGKFGVEANGCLFLFGKDFRSSSAHPRRWSQCADFAPFFSPFVRSRLQPS